MSVGKRIAEVRKKQGLTQEQLADILGTTRQAVSKWESDKTNPDLDYIIHICERFSISTDYLLLGINESADHPPAAPDNGNCKQDSGGKRNRIVFILVMAVGILILLLCPLFATVYRNYISHYAPAYTDPYVYLQEWPLLGVKIAGILLSITGVLGLSWPFIRKASAETCNAWKEC